MDLGDTNANGGDSGDPAADSDDGDGNTGDINA